MVDFRKAAARNGPPERPGRARPLSQPESLGGTLVIICAPNVLTSEELGVIRNELQGAAFIDGASTAGWSAREVKKNLQVDINTESQARLREIVRDAFLRNAMLQASILPSSLASTMVVPSVQ